jgi:hypothetical protein
MEWFAFSEKHIRAHLVSGEFDPREMWRGISRFGALGRLVVALAPAGDWAMNKTRRLGATAIYVAYQLPEDAAKLRKALRAVKAAPALKRERWVTHAEFWFDRTMQAEILGRLAPGTVPEGLATRFRLSVPTRTKHLSAATPHSGSVVSDIDPIGVVIPTKTESATKTRRPLR